MVVSWSTMRYSYPFVMYYLDATYWYLVSGNAFLGLQPVHKYVKGWTSWDWRNQSVITLEKSLMLMLSVSRIKGPKVTTEPTVWPHSSSPYETTAKLESIWNSRIINRSVKWYAESIGVISPSKRVRVVILISFISFVSFVSFISFWSSCSSQPLTIGQHCLSESIYGIYGLAAAMPSDGLASRPIWVCKTGRILFETFHPQAAQVADFLIAVAEPVSRPQIIHDS